MHPADPGVPRQSYEKEKEKDIENFYLLDAAILRASPPTFCHFAVNSHGKRISLGLGLFIMNILMFFK